MNLSLCFMALFLGIFISIVLIRYSILKRSILPKWCLISFCGVGVLMIISCIVMGIGVYVKYM